VREHDAAGCRRLPTLLPGCHLASSYLLTAGSESTQDSYYDKCVTVRIHCCRGGKSEPERLCQLHHYCITSKITGFCRRFSV
jgi:hypothetical protein